ncbi:MAG: PAS domain S-box protein, partial [Desulfovibrionaceae bacterium]
APNGPGPKDAMKGEQDRQELTAELDEARERIQRLEAALRLRGDESFLARLVDCLPTPVFARDEGRRFIYLNQAASRQYGGPREQLLGKRLEELPNFPDASTALFQESRERDQAVLAGADLDEVEFDIRREDGPRSIIVTRGRLEDPVSGRPCVIGHVLDVTERRKAEVELAETRALLEAAVQQSPAGILIADAPSGRVRVVNPAALEVRGQSEAALTDIPIADHANRWSVFLPDGRPCPPEELPLSRAVLHGEVTRNEEYLIRRPSGEDRWVSANAAPIRDSEGAIKAGIVIFSDVTEARRAMQELAASEDHYRGLFENTGAATVILDEDETILRCNARFQMLSGYSRSEIEGRIPWSEFVDPMDLQRMRDFHQRRADLWAEPPPTAYEFTFRDRHGEAKNVQIQVDLIPGTRQRVASLVDVTDRRRAEQALRESESRYRALFESAQDAIFLMHEGRVADANQASLDIFRGAAEDFLGKRPEEFAPPCQPDGSPSDILARRYMEAAMAGEPLFFDWISTRFDGELFEGEVSLSRVKSPERTYLLSLVRDVTERNQSARELARLNQNLEIMVEERNQELSRKAQELEQANRRLREMDALKSGLLATVAHDIRAPLTSVLGFARLVDRDFKRRFEPLVGDDEKLQRYARRIRENLAIIANEGGRLTRLINDFLDLSRIESGRMEWRDERLRPGEVVDQAVSAVSATFETNPGLGLDVDRDFPDGTLMADPDRLQQVLVNLLDNAAKFSGSGQVRLFVSRQSEDRLRFTIQDSGPGIPTEDLERIFDKFHRVRSSDTLAQQPKGAGLGLAICRRIVEHYGGGVWAESQPGHGSAFHVELPAAPAGEDA